MCQDCIYRDLNEKVQHPKCDNCWGLTTNGNGDEFDDNFSHRDEPQNRRPVGDYEYYTVSVLFIGGGRKKHQTNTFGDARDWLGDAAQDHNFSQGAICGWDENNESTLIGTNP